MNFVRNIARASRSQLAWLPLIALAGCAVVGHEQGLPHIRTVGLHEAPPIHRLGIVGPPNPWLAGYQTPSWSPLEGRESAEEVVPAEGEGPQAVAPPPLLPSPRPGVAPPRRPTTDQPPAPSTLPGTQPGDQGVDAPPPILPDRPLEPGLLPEEPQPEEFPENDERVPLIPTLPNREPPAPGNEQPRSQEDEVPRPLDDEFPDTGSVRPPSSDNALRFGAVRPVDYEPDMTVDAVDIDAPPQMQSLQRLDRPSQSQRIPRLQLKAVEDPGAKAVIPQETTWR